MRSGVSGGRLERREGLWVGRFEAMASHCELHVEVEDQILASHLLAVAAEEANRIERKYSRYLPDNPIHAINCASPVIVDEETAGLLDFAGRCHRLSHGRFDVTAGVLRRLWRFDGGDRLPSRRQVKELLPLIGWEKVDWRSPSIALRPGMELDLGGIGKEYAVDRAIALLGGETAAPLLLNFGGDLRVSGARRDGQPWRVAIEDPRGDASRNRFPRRSPTEGRRSGQGDRDLLGRPRHERGQPPLPAAPRRPLLAHTQSTHRLADNERAPLGDRCRAHLHGGRHDRDLRHAARRRGRGLPGRAGGRPLVPALALMARSAARARSSRRPHRSA